MSFRKATSVFVCLMVFAATSMAADKVGIHRFCERTPKINKKCGWEKGCDSRDYIWKADWAKEKGAKVVADKEDKVEGKLSHVFKINYEFSRFVLEMNPKVKTGTVDFSPYSSLRFSLKSSDAKNWGEFQVILEDKSGKSYAADIYKTGFKGDGEWHKCAVDLKSTGLDLTKMFRIFQINWGKGAKKGTSFKLDDVHLSKEAAPAIANAMGKKSDGGAFPIGDPGPVGKLRKNKKFTPAQLKFPGKKGICFTLRDKGKKGDWVKNIPKVKKLNVYWNYSWGSNLIPAQPDNLEFVPMSWGARSMDGLKKNINTNVIPQIKSGKAKRFLAFNEPDKHDQSNMPYKKALEYWPFLESLGVPLASPACANPEGINDPSAQGVKGTWMRDFMKEVDKKGLRVDYTAVHWYGGTSAPHFKAKMKRLYEKYGRRPILITEFACANWKTGGKFAKNKFTPKRVLEFMKDVLPWLEKQDWVAGYAWYSFMLKEPPGYGSALIDEKGNLTACGRYYKSVTTENPQGDQSIKPDPAKN